MDYNNRKREPVDGRIKVQALMDDRLIQLTSRLNRSALVNQLVLEADDQAFKEWCGRSDGLPRKRVCVLLDQEADARLKTCNRSAVISNLIEEWAKNQPAR